MEHLRGLDASPLSLRAADGDEMNNQVSSIRVHPATDIDDLPARLKAVLDPRRPRGRGCGRQRRGPPAPISRLKVAVSTS